MHAIMRLPKSVLFAAPLAAAIVCFAPADGSAQFGTGMRTQPDLSQSDIAMVRKLVREDLTGKPKGTTLSWNNPDTTNSGTVTLLDQFPSKGRDCRKVRYIVKPGPKQPASSQPANYVLTSCKYADGTWKLDNGAAPDK